MRHTKHYIWMILFSVIALGCTTTPQPPITSAEQPNYQDSKYRIGIGDSLFVSVWRHEELSLEVPVRPDGMISVPLVGDVTVGGLTPEEVDETITTEMSEFVRDPVVTVIVTNMGSDNYRSRVRVTGAVMRPLSTPYRQGMTVLDVVLEAGGVNEFASPSRAALYRQGEAPKKIDLRGILDRGDLRTNFVLRPGDVITVPTRIL